MANTEKTMNPQVLEFIEQAKKTQIETSDLEMQRQQAERDALLISLGLYRNEIVEVEKQVAYKINFDGVKYDEENDIYYREIKCALDVTDEEFEEIKKYAPQKENIGRKEGDDINNSAEQLLGVINGLSLVVCCILALILVVGGISNSESYEVCIGVCLALVSLISYACIKVVLNISNNLHQINSKLK